MNDKHPGGPGAEPGDPQERAGGADAPHGNAPFRRLRSGRRRAEPTAPLDHAPDADSSEEPRHPSRHGAPATAPESGPQESVPAAEAAPLEELPVRDHHHAEVLQAHPVDDGATDAAPESDAVHEHPEAASDDGEPVEDEDPTTSFLLSGGRTTPGVRKRRRRRRNIIMAIMVGVFAVILAGTVLILQNFLGMWAPEDYPGPGEGSVTFTVEPGWGPGQIGGHLADDGIVSDKTIFIDAIQQVDAENKTIHPGKYELKYKMRALDAATILVGQAAEKVNYVAIKQNVRTTAVFEAVNKATGIPVADLAALNKKPGDFGLKAPVSNLEGFLHPGEYRFPLDASAKDILQQMVDATLKELTSQGVTDPAEQYKMLKIASILQAEARPKDYKTVSGALDNRLKPDNTETGGYLQVDSAVIYGLDRYTLQLTKQEKADKSNKYNTYAHQGLPPTPIGSPADTAIEAAIHPEKNDYYYWVTVNTQTGETKFAKTYEQHKVYQQQFRDWCQANEATCK
ncbi:endolytic transglycosylase MltG [Arthrobacter sp.]|uniref:endolytic transglycosylase MltG n=1 Tax=Arthrobacter sp. TaxID=1667 RepID=UPI003A94DC2C